MEKMNGDLDAFSDVIRKLSTELNTDLTRLKRDFYDLCFRKQP